MACIDVQRDEKIDALLREAKLVDERRAEFSSLCENIRHCEEEMKQQRELICKEVRETVLSFASRLGRWNGNCPHTDSVSDALRETQREKLLTGKEPKGYGKETASESPLLNMTPPFGDLSMSEQTVPSCDGSCDSVSYHCDSFYPESRTSDSPKLCNPSEGKSGHHFRHTKVVFMKSHSHKGKKRHRIRPRLTPSHATPRCVEDQERTNIESIEIQCVAGASGGHEKSLVPVTPTSISSVGKSSVRLRHCTCGAFPHHFTLSMFRMGREEPGRSGH